MKRKSLIVCFGTLFAGLVAFGGESVRTAVFAGGRGAWEIGKLVALTEKTQPNALVFCAAVRDNPRHVQERVAFFDKMGAKATAVLISNPNQKIAEGVCVLRGKAENLTAIREAILAADLVWFDGGATEELARSVLFAHLGDALRIAYRKGTVMAGYSAGAIFLSHAGLTDYPADRYDFVEGLGLVNCYYCPHYEGGSEKTWKGFDRRLEAETDASLPAEAWAVEDGTMVVFRNERPEVLNNNPKRHDWHFVRGADGKWTKTEALPPLSSENAVTKPSDLLVTSQDFVWLTGDSITAYGRDHGVQRLVPMALAALGVKPKWRSQAYGGRVSKEVLAELDKTLASKPTVVLIQCGINDVNNVKGKEEFEDLAGNLEKIWSAVEAAGARPVQIGLVQEKTGYDRGWTSRIKELCESRAKKVAYADVAAEMIPVWLDPAVPTVPNRSFTKQTTDGIHPNSLGFRQMSWAVLKALGFKEADKARVYALWTSRVP